MIICFLVLVLTMSCLITVFWGLYEALRRTSYEERRRKAIFRNVLIIVTGWLLLLSILSWNGSFAALSEQVPLPVLVFLLPLPAVLIIAFSKSFSRMLYIIPPTWLIYMQSFRIWVAIILWMALIEDHLPRQMTFEGSDFDIMAGITAPLIGYCCFDSKSWPAAVAVAWNILGLLLLINLLVMAVLSLPGPFQYFTNGPTNNLFITFPFILLPGILIPIAYSMHIFSLRQLLQQKRIRAAAH